MQSHGSTEKGKKEVQKGVSSLTYLQALALESQKKWGVPGASYKAELTT